MASAILQRQESIVSQKLLVLGLSVQGCHSFSILFSNNYSRKSAGYPIATARREGISRNNTDSVRSIFMSSGRGKGETTWRSDCTQEEFMKKDECILVDGNDMIVGHSSKYDAHRFDSPKQPTGLLHRAFSVFLFDSDSRLLLQQRAASKITFPNVWTNTCCSHPLHGYNPTEVDDLSKSGNKAPGAARAAIRKLEHELGIDTSNFHVDDFKFLTRLHYCAKDSMNPEWGEHEMDYILFCRKDVKDLLNPHPDEVQATRFVTRDELKDMMRPDSGLLWSPWFRIISERFLDAWWDDLDATLSTDDFVEPDAIHKILS